MTLAHQLKRSNRINVRLSCPLALSAVNTRNTITESTPWCSFSPPLCPSLSRSLSLSLSYNDDMKDRQLIMPEKWCNTIMLLMFSSGNMNTSSAVPYSLIKRQPQLPQICVVCVWHIWCISWVHTAALHEKCVTEAWHLITHTMTFIKIWICTSIAWILCVRDNEIEIVQY